jgi:ElaB/YqjD/DUF883 family membrane-anchored ribosome-binding protein
MNMTALSKIKDEFQNDYASQIAAVRSDVKQLRSDILTLRDDIVEDAHAAKRLGKRAERELRVRGKAIEERSRNMARAVSNEVQQHPLVTAALASAVVCAASAFAYWSSKHSAAA